MDFNLIYFKHQNQRIEKPIEEIDLTKLASIGEL